MIAILSRLAIIFLSIIVIFSGFAPLSSYELSEKDGLVMSFVAISDTHIQGSDSTQTRRLMRGLDDMKEAQTRPDALVIAGDLTTNGKSIEHFFLYSALTSSYDINSIILAAGDQDLNIKDKNYAKASKRFTSGFNRLTGRDVDSVYYSTVVKGHYFIVLGSETIAGTQQSFSRDQLDWLQYTLDQAVKENAENAIFIINHNPLSGTNKVEEFWANGGSAGEQSDEIMNIIKEYKNVFFLSGHLCAPYNNSGVTLKNGVTFVDLPAYNYSGGESGIAYIVEVYESEIIFRARNLLRSQWVDYSYTAQLTR